MLRSLGRFKSPSYMRTTIRRCFSSQTTIDNYEVCIVGAGPAGFYTAHALLKSNDKIKVHFIEKLPVPYGLVRFGVAPDHPEVKNVIDQFAEIARSDRVTFSGNISLGQDVTLTDLRARYSAVVLSYGAEDDRQLQIPGEDYNGVYSARSFVGWYNGLPEHQHLEPNLNCSTAVVLGQGNVAVDIARILLSPIDLLAKTDITEQALQTISESSIERVLLVGRRGPIEAAFTIKEFREMTKLPGCNTIVNEQDMEFSEEELEYVNGRRPLKRLTELLRKTAADKTQVREGKHWELLFRESPTKVYDSVANPGVVAGVTLQHNELVGDVGARWAQPVVDNKWCDSESLNIECGAVFRSIGYKGVAATDESPFDDRKGVLRNKDGRVEGQEGVYCSGWIKTGPTGVIATTMGSAFETARAILHDLKSDLLKPVADIKPIDFGPQIVSWNDWEAIEKQEKQIGQSRGKPAEKVTSIKTMLEIAHNNTAP
eukprot:m.199836 g.199836  ORF g.199836 m.199836 type:complete len:485 (+) comp32751_c0_seq3:193-1647(+)